MTTRIGGGVVHKVPGDMRQALTASTKVSEAWNSLTPLARNEWI
ncbi:YdeI/OmpD-associated family protein, partial [Candidatus Kaiserbacteria bacterium]|nr:YdeI/OmpD-associated family protein [Candidatus Kaiserbacteria bacterium]